MDNNFFKINTTSDFSLSFILIAPYRFKCVFIDS